MKFVLEVSYHGAAYHGWQIQENAHTVQAEIERVLQILLKESIPTLGSGRTDTGVHAAQQFVSFEANHLPSNFLYRFNALLPTDIAVRQIYTASDHFHVRHHPIHRTYQYTIARKKNPFVNGQAYLFLTRSLNIEQMNKAAQSLLNYQDFESFSKVHTEVASFQCRISKAEWFEEKDLLIFEITADRFLRGMVRAIVGSLLEVGTGKWSPDDFNEVILAKNRNRAGRAAPPEGLSLVSVLYPEGALTPFTI